MEKTWAAISTFLLIGSIAGYVLERDQFQNLIDLKRLFLMGLAISFLAAALIIFLFRKRFETWPPRLAVGFFIVLISPLILEVLDRKGAKKSGHESFVFEREEARFTSFGIQKGESIQPNQFILRVQKEGKKWAFKHRKHALFPLTKSGEPILLPTETGRFGFRKVVLD